MLKTPKIRSNILPIRDPVSPKLTEQQFGLFENRPVEAFGEPAVDRCEQIPGFGALALITPEAGEVGGGAWFPSLRALATRDLDGLTEGDLRAR
jgi:hypothetical protein